MKTRIALILPLFLLIFSSCDQNDQMISSGSEDNLSIGESLEMNANASNNSIPGRFIVVLEPKSNPGNIASEYGISADYEYRHVINGFAGDISQAAREGLLRDNRVVRIEQDGVVTMASTTQNNATWGLDRIDQRELQLDGKYVYANDGSGVTAYILDTGILSSHQEFTGRVQQGFDAFGGNSEDCNGHGTHVAGTVGGTVYGVAKNVNLVAVRILDCGGSGSFSGVIAGMDWVAENASQPAVANMSLTGGASSAMNEAVENLFNSGVPTIVAAGNGNRGGRGVDACNYSPAGSPKAYTVGATTQSDARTTFSNYGSCVDIFAPGSGITSAWHTSNTSTRSISGTSMSAPHVAGVAALYLQNNSNASSQDVYDAITASSTKNIVTNSNTTNNHIVYSLLEDSGDGGNGGDDGGNNGGDDEIGDNPPVVDTLSASSRSNGPWQRVDTSWSVSDEDGDLDNLVIELLNGSTVVDSETVSISGSNASGTTELRTRNSANSVRLTVTDSKGNSGTDSINF